MELNWTNRTFSRSMNSNSTEVAYNLSLARLLRLEGLSAEGEQRRVFGDSHGQADVLLDFDDYAVVVEAEFGSPAKSDADKRLLDDAPAIVNGLPVRLVVAVGYPPRLAELPESQTESNLASCEDLVIAYRYFGDPWSEETVGSVATLAEILRDYWIQSDNGIGIEETVRRAAQAIKVAGDVLSRVDPENRSEQQDGPATKALIWLNAMLFQELLARHLDTSLLSPEHHSKRILRPDPERGPDHLVRQWIEILEINWWPIFHIAKETLKTTPAPTNRQAVSVLKQAAAEIAEIGAIRRHDVAGRIFHRLLDSRKFLATNYTTIPAAILLAGLAFDERNKCWAQIDFSDPKSVATLRIVDPACGSGTLLMAVAQEILKHGRRGGSMLADEREVVRFVLERALYGFDVVPAAIHLAASTLCMAEARQLIQDMNLWRVRHDVDDGVPRLGSLDFLVSSPSKGNAARLPLFEEEVSVRVTGTGEVDDDVIMPRECHLIIANPPYTRAGGPGDKKNTLWNPIFGSLLNAGDAEKMKASLKKSLQGTPASLYAGLGSAFVVLADENLAVNGRIAFVLPATMLTGSRWSGIRQLLLSKYAIDWVIVSHDIRNRSAKKGLPGRRWVSFSESTRIAEVLIVATKDVLSLNRSEVKFVNLIHNPDEPVEAMTLMRKLLAMDEDAVSLESRSIDIGETAWGSMIAVPQKNLTDDAWSYTTFAQSELALIAEGMRTSAYGPLASVPLTELQVVMDLGPYHMQVKNPKQGLFNIFETNDNLRTGIPVLWHHKSIRNTTLEAKADARLERRSDRDPFTQDAMLARQGRLQLACDLGMAPQRVAAVLTNTPMLGVSSWITLIPRSPALGKEEALCLWLNSTPGLLLRILHSNRPYLGRSRLTHELSETLPILDVNKLSNEQLATAVDIYENLKGKLLQGFSGLVTDPVRCELNARLCQDVLNIEPSVVEKLTQKLALEPTLHVRH